MGLIGFGRAKNFYGIDNLTRKHQVANYSNCNEMGACLFLVILYSFAVFILWNIRLLKHDDTNIYSETWL